MSLVQIAAGITVMHQPCPAYLPVQVSCYVPETRTVYVRPKAFAPRFTLAHEYGHAWDYERLNDTSRGHFRQLLGFAPETPWRTPGFYSPSEAFANAYADCALGTKRQIRGVCALLPASPYVAWLKQVRHRT